MELILLSLLWLEQEVPVTLLTRTQKAFQSIDYKSDLELWGESEYWATPAELLDKGQGDCEDVAIAKYFLLIEQGVPMDRLRLAYQLLEDGDVHMLLEYHHAPHHTYLLDIQVNDISLATPLHFEQQILSFNNSYPPKPGRKQRKVPFGSLSYSEHFLHSNLRNSPLKLSSNIQLFQKAALNYFSLA